MTFLYQQARVDRQAARVTPLDLKRMRSAITRATCARPHCSNRASRLMGRGDEHVALCGGCADAARLDQRAQRNLEMRERMRRGTR